MVEPNGAVAAKFGIPGLKAAFNHLGMNGGYLRSPLRPLSEEKKKILFKILDQSGITGVGKSLNSKL
eukprot:UN10147